MSSQEKFPINDSEKGNEETIRKKIKIEETPYVDKWVHKQMEGYSPRIELEIDERITELKRTNPPELDDSKSNNQLRSDIKREIGKEMFDEEIEKRIIEKLKSPRWKQELGEE